MTSFKRIGMEKKLQLEWLGRVVALAKDEADPKLIRADMDRYLLTSLPGSESRRKHIDVLMRIWVKVADENKQLRDEALLLWERVSARERVALHWGLCLLAYPIFKDVTAAIGKLLNLQDDVLLSQVHKRIVDSWGERTTLRYAVQRLLRTLTWWGVLAETGKKGVYRAGDEMDVQDKDGALWLLHCYIQASAEETVPLTSLLAAPALFPFKLNVRLSDLGDSERFEVTRQGLNSDVVGLR